MSDEDSSVATGRSRRVNSRRVNKFASAFEKLKKVRDGTIRHEVDEEEDVFDEVDEDEYCDIVSKRRQDEFIVDDDGTYADDGEELFYYKGDDEEGGGEKPTDDTSVTLYKGKKKKTSKKTEEPSAVAKNSIKKFFSAAPLPSKKAIGDVNIDNDQFLDNILDDLKNEITKPQPLKLMKKATTSTESNPFVLKKKATATLAPKPSKFVATKRQNDVVKDINFDDILNDDFVLEEPMQQSKHFKSDLFKENYMDMQVTHETTINETFKPPVNSTTDMPTIISSIADKQLPFEEDEKGDKYLNFFWLDAYEDPARNSGIVYLFGKVWIESVKRHVSCCVTVQNISKRLFLLPRKGKNENDSYTVKEVYQEFKDKIAPTYKIASFKSRSIRKFYAFEKADVPAEAEYLEVQFTNNQVLPTDLSGQSFSHAFGTNTSNLERVLTDKKMKGPGWLKIKNPELSENPVSWCKVELVIKKFEDQLNVLEENKAKNLTNPDFTLLCLKLQTYLNPMTKLNEIIAISCLANRSFSFEKSYTKDNMFDFHFCAVTKPSGNKINLPLEFKPGKPLTYKGIKVETLHSERELLNFFMAKFQQIDPDIVVGHDIYNFDYELMLSRFAHYKLPAWSKLGRLKRSGLPNRVKDKYLVCGRIVCDTKISSKELIRAKSYELTELAIQIFKEERKSEIDQTTLHKYFASTGQMFKFINNTLMDNNLILRITLELNALPLALQITKIAGNLLSRTLLGGRSERNEFLLLHAFKEKNYICPDKSFSKSSNENDDKKRKKAAYAGGLVLEPKVGFYNRFILLMDFNSLYPSIIQEYNICFTTVERKSEIKSETENENQVDDDFIPQLPAEDSTPGILPTEIKKLVDSRREVKKLLCDPKLSNELKQQYDIRQKALKLTANSMYGCLGFSHSRFYAKPLAALTTFKGREILMHTKQLVEKLGLEVVYGDTDSIMILTNCITYDEVKSIGSQVQEQVNKLYKLLEIDIDGVFRSMLLLKKKKYAAMIAYKLPNGEINYKKEVKGLDIVRRDWSILAKEAGEQILDFILIDNPSNDMIVDNIHNYLKQLASNINSENIPVEKFVISKALTKSPEEYSEKKALTHVAVALRYNNSNKTKPLRGGDTVPYIICQDTSSTENLPATQRGYHPDELKENKNLKIDAKYYLSQQVHPVVARLCEPIDGTDPNILAEFLGLESTSYKSKYAQELASKALLETGEHKYDLCKSLILVCPNARCVKNVEIRSVVKTKENVLPDEPSLARCPHCHMDFPKYVCFFESQVRKVLNNLISAFYKFWMKCEDPTCGHRTQEFTGRMTKKGPKCPDCNSTLLPEISEADLNLQLMFYKQIFHLNKILPRLAPLSEIEKKEKGQKFDNYRPFYDRLKAIVAEYLDACAYSQVDLDHLFRKFSRKFAHKSH